jgi:uncharacterized LabA/DUF88 family protein
MRPDSANTNMPSTPNDKLAVLIDADNAQASGAAALLAEVSRYGIATVKRAYGDWTTPNLKGWKDVLHALAIQPVQQFSYTTGKNATDSALIIDAMDLLHAGGLDGFCLVSSDSDFTRLATRLREAGKTVYGFGERKTPAPFVAACDKFVYVEILAGRAEPAPVATDKAAVKLKTVLLTAIDATDDDEGWAALSAVGSTIQKNDPAFDPRNHGFPKLSELVRAQAYLDVRKDGQQVAVRRKPAGG